MPRIQTQIDPRSPDFIANFENLRTLVEDLKQQAKAALAAQPATPGRPKAGPEPSTG